MAFRLVNFFSRLFKSNKSPITEKVEQIDYSSRNFSSFNGNAYESDIYRTAVDAIARNAAKLKATHVVTMPDNRKIGDTQLNRILQMRPNPFMSAYDLFYKLVTHYFLNNNAFAYLQKDERGNLLAIYPLAPSNVEYLSDDSQQIYCRFTFQNGSQVTLNYNEVFIARRFFNSNDLLGDDNSAIMSALDLAHTQNEGMEYAIKSGASIRGLLKYTQVLSPENLKAEKERFEADYLSVKNNGGIAMVDSKVEYVPLKSEPITIDEKQLQAIETKIYKYLGINESIVNSTYTENEWAAFYESVLEPIAVQFALELTEKIFTQREQAFGNSIILEANRLQFASTATKTNVIKELMPFGLLTINQALEILNLPAVEDGDRRLQTLNVVNADKADQYQLDEQPKQNKEGEQNEVIK